MSQYANNCKTLREMLGKYPGKESAVVDTFYSMIYNEGWAGEEILEFLHSAKGISSEVDAVLEIFIEKEKIYE